MSDRSVAFNEADALSVFAQIAETRRIWAAVERLAPRDAQGLCILVTSAARAEGKSLLAAGFAALAAQRPQTRVAAADLNWHRPALHRFFNLTPAFDVARLRGGASLTDLARPAGAPNLFVLTAPTLPAAAVDLAPHDSDLAADIVRRLKAAYEVVIVDGAAVFPTNRRMIDPVRLGAVADGVVLTVMANATPRQEVKKARVVLERAGARVLGLVLNQRHDG